MTESKIEKKGVGSQVADTIMEQIRSGQLKPGDKLPNEKEMAESFGISRVSLREGLKLLSAKGLISTKHGGGTYVNPFGEDTLSESFCIYAAQDDSLALEMLDVRRLIETEAARLASIYASDEEIEKIHKYMLLREEALSAELQGENRSEQRYYYDEQFHLAIAQASHNTVFVNFIKMIHRTLGAHQQQASVRSGKTETSYYHQEIYRAIVARQPEKAAEMMTKHIETIASYY